jgi:hypothetical protein
MLRYLALERNTIVLGGDNPQGVVFSTVSELMIFEFSELSSCESLVSIVMPNSMEMMEDFALNTWNGRGYCSIGEKTIHLTIEKDPFRSILHPDHSMFTLTSRRILFGSFRAP